MYVFIHTQLFYNYYTKENHMIFVYNENNNKNLHLYTKQQRLYTEVYNKKVYKCFQGRHSIHKYTGQREK